MVTLTEILPETAKALSAPVTKLIEVVAAGCGRLHEPHHTRKMAAAQGDSLVLMAEAKARASEIGVRAAQRALDNEVRRQENIEAIALIAEGQLPSEVSSTPVEADWAVRFFQTCQDVSDQSMQVLWAKLLAGEVQQPGSFSLRTIQVLSQLSKEEAITFESLCTQSPTAGALPVILVFSTESTELASVGLKTPHQLYVLEEAGLLSRAEMGKVFTPAHGQPLRLWLSPNEHLSIRNEKPVEKFSMLSDGQIPAGIYSLTVSGRELGRLVACAPSPERVAFLVAAFEKEGMTIVREAHT